MTASSKEARLPVLFIGYLAMICVGIAYFMVIGLRHSSASTCANGGQRRANPSANRTSRPARVELSEITNRPGAACLRGNLPLTGPRRPPAR